MDKIKDFVVKRNDVTPSFDMTFLFTSINLKPANKMPEELLHKQSSNNLLQTSTFWELIDSYLSIYFSLDVDIYERIEEAPMGLPTSGFFEVFLMHGLENIALSKIQPKIRIP